MMNIAGKFLLLVVLFVLFLFQGFFVVVLPFTIRRRSVLISYIQMIVLDCVLSVDKNFSKYLYESGLCYSVFLGRRNLGFYPIKAGSVCRIDVSDINLVAEQVTARNVRDDYGEYVCVSF